MKYTIDMIDDIRASIENDGTFLMGTLALEKNLDSDGNSTVAWAKAISSFKLCESEKKLCFYMENSTPINVKEFLDASQQFSNEIMMYEIVIFQHKNIVKEIVGFSENREKKTYMLLIEE